MKKDNLRSMACELAKKLSQEKGGTPASHLKEAWATVKQDNDLPTFELKFFAVRYKMVTGQSLRSIVPAETNEAACRKFYDPDDEFGPKNKIIDITKARKIPQGWTVQFDNNGIRMAGIISEDLSLSKNTTFEVKVQGKKYDITFNDVVSAVPTQKDRVMK
jgi:hypothetical protein